MNVTRRHCVNLICTLVGLLFATTLLCCGKGGGAKGTEREESTAQAADSAALSSDAQKHLPDTVFPSAEAVKYTVEETLPEVDGTLVSLDNLYAGAPGIFIFRGSPYRDASFTGTLDKEPTDIVVDWKFSTAIDKKWGGGSGWTGQPVYVEWPDSMVRKFRKSGKVSSDFSGKEIMVGSLGCHIYFIDYETGKASRSPIDVHNPIKGAISLDPTLNGNLYVGHGINNSAPFGAITIDLNSHEISHSFGRDPKAGRSWGAYDSNAIRVDRFLFRAGENGTLYKWYISSDGTPKLHSALRFTRNGAAPGIESSLAVYKNYGYFGDNAGNFLCVNLDTMRPVWFYDNHDDTDASPLIAVEDGVPMIYTGNEVDKQGEGKAWFTKLNGLTGEKVWEHAIDSKSVVIGTTHFDGGYYSSPLLGRGNCEDLIFTTVVYNQEKRQNGNFIAYDRKSGKVKYEIPLKRYAWSSPVALMGKNNNMYVFAADTYGNVYIINGIDGRVLLTKQIGANFESSPVVAGNSVVVGSRGTDIIKMTIK